MTKAAIFIVAEREKKIYFSSQIPMHFVYNENVNYKNKQTKFSV